MIPVRRVEMQRAEILTSRHNRLVHRIDQWFQKVQRGEIQLPQICPQDEPELWERFQKASSSPHQARNQETFQSEDLQLFRMFACFRDLWEGDRVEGF